MPLRNGEPDLWDKQEIESRHLTYRVVSLFVSGFVMFVVLIAGGMYGCPQYNVWQQELSGQAELARASQNRQIAIQEAEAKSAAAELLAEAEIKRAHGVAEANKIVAESLGGPEGYLRWLWIDQVTASQNQMIYVPTEAGLPILEASRLTPK